MTNAEVWVPLVAALGGAAIGGAISIVGQHLSAIHQAKVQENSWKEERARWAAEQEMSDFRQLFDSIEAFSEAVVQFRIRKAREVHAKETGHEVHQFVSADKARDDFENGMWNIRRSLMLLDESSAEWSDEFTSHYNKWMLAATSTESIQALRELECSIAKCRGYIAARYKEAIERRK